MHFSSRRCDGSWVESKLDEEIQNGPDAGVQTNSAQFRVINVWGWKVIKKAGIKSTLNFGVPRNHSNEIVEEENNEKIHKERGHRDKTETLFLGFPIPNGKKNAEAPVHTKHGFRDGVEEVEDGGTESREKENHLVI